MVQFSDKKITGTGKVVRVEQNAPGAAIGIALQFSMHDVTIETAQL